MTQRIQRISELSENEISALSRLFSSSVIQEMARKGRSSLFARLAREGSLFKRVSPAHQVRDLFELAFGVLKKKVHRHEYVYKSALTQNVLLGTHRLNTAAMLTEFRVGSCKADLVILNGTGTVYEIKSERDSLARLKDQIEAYRQVFASVYVIAGEKHIGSIFDIVPDDVGIMQLSNRNNIKRVRKATDLPERTSSSVIFESLRSSEAKEILLQNGFQVPQVPNTELHSALRERFLQLPSACAHRGMVNVLKKTRDLMPLAGLIERLPRSLQSAALSIPLRRVDHDRLLKAVDAPVGDALGWA